SIAINGLAVEGFKYGKLFRWRIPEQRHLVSGTYLFTGIVAGIHHAPREMFGSFNIYRIIERDKRLQGRVRGNSSHEANFTTRCIESNSRWIRTRTLKKCIHRSSVPVLAFAHNPLFAVVDRHPDLVGLI